MIDKLQHIKDKQHSWSEERYRSVDSEGMHRYLDGIPKGLANDYYLRLAMENVLSWSHDEILVSTKIVQASDLIEVYSMDLDLPIYLPRAYSHGTHNEQLKMFAFDAYDVLQCAFGSSEWGEWLVIPHYQHGSDTFEAVTLGVFICNNSQQVVE